MLLKMIDHLMGHFVLTQRLLTCWLAKVLCVTSEVTELASDTEVTKLGFLYMAESAKLNSMWKWLPLKIEHWVNWLDFNPPGSSLESLSYNTRIVPRGNNKFVAVFYICVFKRYLTDRPFFSSPCLSCSYWLLLILVVQLSSKLLCIEDFSWSYVFLIENLLNFCRNLCVI